MRDALAAAGWSSAALDELLGRTYRTHLDRGELAPVLRRTRDRGALATLARLFVTGTAVAAADARTAGVPDSWLRPADGGASGRTDGPGSPDRGEVRAAVGLQPVAHDGQEVTVPHDLSRPAAGVQPDQVLGVGAASLTLAAATPRERVDRALDLGAGCGVQALLLAGTARAVTATDSNPRAAGYARLAGLLNDVPLDVREGDLLGPVQGERFDLVVSNPPFVVAPARRYTYRDSGFSGDDLSHQLVRQLPAVLDVQGLAVLLVNWLHVDGEDGDERVRSWVEGTGCDAWIVQRELAAPEDYVTAWLRDTDEGEHFDSLYDEWLDHLTAHRVQAVAFGVLALRRTDGPTSTVLDVVDQPLAETWGGQVRAHFAGRDLLRRDPMTVAWRLRQDVRLTQVAARTDDGWLAEHQVLSQRDGLRWTGEVDLYGATLLAGCDGTRPLGDLVAVLAASAGLSTGEAADQVVPVVRRLVEQGFLVP